MFPYMAVDDAVLSRGYGKEIQLGLDPLARLSMYESHRRICRPHVSIDNEVFAVLICWVAPLLGGCGYATHEGSGHG